MVNRICTLKDIRVHITRAGVLETYFIDSGGLERSEPTYVAHTGNNASRYYRCRNCGYESPGDEDYTMQDHLGKFHELIDPFNLEEKHDI